MLQLTSPRYGARAPQRSQSRHSATQIHHLRNLHATTARAHPGKPPHHALCTSLRVRNVHEHLTRDVLFKPTQTNCPTQSEHPERTPPFVPTALVSTRCSRNILCVFLIAPCAPRFKAKRDRFSYSSSTHTMGLDLGLLVYANVSARTFPGPGNNMIFFLWDAMRE